MGRIRKAALGFIKGLDGFNYYCGVAVSFLILAMTLAILREIIGRYIFNSPTAWVLEFCEYSILFLIYLGGAYTLLIGGHVKIDIISKRWSLRTRSIADIISSVIGMLYLAVLIWQGIKMALHSLASGALSSGAVAWPLFPLQMIVPIGCFLFLLQFISIIYRSLKNISPKGS